MASQGSSDPAAAGTDPLRYDLTTTIAGSLDRHLVFPLLEFLSSKQLYPAEDIEQAKLELIEKTNMVDYAVDIYQSLHQTDEVRGGAGAARGACGRRPAALSAVQSTCWTRKRGVGVLVAWGTSSACLPASHAHPLKTSWPMRRGASRMHAQHAHACHPSTNLTHCCCCLRQVPPEFVARRQEVVGKLRTLETQVKTITDFLSNADNVKLLKQDKAQNQAFLASEFNIGVCVERGEACARL